MVCWRGGGGGRVVEWWWEGDNETRECTAWADCKRRAVFLFGLSQLINILFYVCKVIQDMFHYVTILYDISDMFQICYDITCFRYVTILYDISDMFQICYDIVRYFRNISSGFWTQCRWSCIHPASLILRGVRDHKAKWRQFLNCRCVQISNLAETRHWGRSLSENLICDGSHNGTKRNPLYLGRLHKWFMLVKC